MEIQHGKGPWAPPVSGIVPLGSTLTLVVAINDYRGTCRSLRLLLLHLHDDFLCRRVRYARQVVRGVRRRRPRDPIVRRVRLRAPPQNDKPVPQGTRRRREGVGDNVRVLPRVQVPGCPQRPHQVQSGDLPARMPRPLPDPAGQGRRRFRPLSGASGPQGRQNRGETRARDGGSARGGPALRRHHRRRRRRRRLSGEDVAERATRRQADVQQPGRTS
jgi:hypothetical protein